MKVDFDSLFLYCPSDSEVVHSCCFDEYKSITHRAVTSQEFLYLQQIFIWLTLPVLACLHQWALVASEGRTENSPCSTCSLKRNGLSYWGWMQP